MTVINNKAIIAACTEFGARIGSELDSREGDSFDIALKACLSALASKPLTKKASSGPSPSSLEKIANKRSQIVQLGGTVDETITKLGELNTIIKGLKAVKKAEEKAVKDAVKAEEKAKKVAASDAKKATKALTKSPSFPKDDWRTAMFPNEKLGKTPEWAGKNGKRLRIAIHKENATVKMKVIDNWTDKASDKFAEMFPDGKFVTKTKIKKKKIVKKKTQADTLADEQAAIIAKLVAPTDGETKNDTENPDETLKITQAKDAAESKALDEAKALVEAKAAEAKAVEAKAAEAKALVEAKAVEAKAVEAKAVEAKALVEEEEELVEIEVEEPDFPGEDEVDEFSHESLEKWEDIDFYKDEDDNVWDENMDFVGTYDDDDSTISFKEGYTPEE